MFTCPYKGKKTQLPISTTPILDHLSEQIACKLREALEEAAAQFPCSCPRQMCDPRPLDATPQRSRHSYLPSTGARYEALRGKLRFVSGSAPRERQITSPPQGRIILFVVLAHCFSLFLPRSGRKARNCSCLSWTRSICASHTQPEHVVCMHQKQNKELVHSAS